MSPTGSRNAPEAKAREKIDALLAQAGWLVQDREDTNLTAGDGIAVREFTLEKGHGYVDGGDRRPHRSKSHVGPM